MVDVIYEDNHLLVCIKPQNTPTQKDITNDSDMLTMAKNYLKDKYQKVYDPLTINYPCNMWRWLEEPWPWERGNF